MEMKLVISISLFEEKIYSSALIMYINYYSCDLSENINMYTYQFNTKQKLVDIIHNLKAEKKVSNYNETN